MRPKLRQAIDVAFLCFEESVTFIYQLEYASRGEKYEHFIFFMNDL
jgi:hypothetical protein